MKNTRKIINDLERKYEEISYYYSIVEVIENTVITNPDISIESCKSLIEGLAKFTLQKLDKSYDSVSINKLDFQPLFKKSITELADYSLQLELDFINRANSLIIVIGDIRNKRGDISHGRLAPKDVISESYFSSLILQMTDAIVFYWLTCFSLVEIQVPLKYEDNQDYNISLDELNPLGSLSYSKALFDQELITYKQGLEAFLDSKLSEQ